MPVSLPLEYMNLPIFLCLCVRNVPRMVLFVLLEMGSDLMHMITENEACSFQFAHPFICNYFGFFMHFICVIFTFAYFSCIFNSILRSLCEAAICRLRHNVWNILQGHKYQSIFAIFPFYLLQDFLASLLLTPYSWHSWLLSYSHVLCFVQTYAKVRHTSADSHFSQCLQCLL